MAHIIHAQTIVSLFRNVIDPTGNRHIEWKKPIGLYIPGGGGALPAFANALNGSPQFSGYRNFMAELTAETEKFKGQVLMVHGDTHFFKHDMPLYSPTKLLPNFTRLETFGSPSVHWVRVVVDASNPQLFTIQPVIVR